MIEFTIFDTNLSLNKEKTNIKIKLAEDMHDILKNAISDLPEYKYLERCEAAISSDDEKKQIRFYDYTTYMYGDLNSDHKIYFTQSHAIEYLTASELYIISKKIKKSLESYLGYSIYGPRLLVDVKCLKHCIDNEVECC